MNDQMTTRVRIPLRAWLRLLAFVLCSTLVVVLMPSRYASAGIVVAMSACMAGNFVRNVWFRDRAAQLRAATNARRRSPRLPFE
jgi:hypothetical protein